MTRDPVVGGLFTRANKRSTVYIFDRSRHRGRVMFVMGDVRRFTLKEARAEVRRLLAIVEEGGDPRPYRRREWCDECDGPWDYVERGRRPTSCPKCRTVTCAECGKVSVLQGSAAAAGQRRYCSKPCSGKGLRTLGEHECGECGAVFRGRPDSANKYCSRACAFKDQVAWQTEKTPMIELTCEECSTVYLRRDSGATYPNKYCGMKCQGRALEVECRQCGTTFSAPAYGQLVCSDTCDREYHRARDAEKYRLKVAGSVRRGYPANRKRGQRTCVGCWEPYLGSANQKYCAPRCMARSVGKPTIKVAGSVEVARHFLSPGRASR